MKTVNIWCNVMNHVSLTFDSSSWLQVYCNRTCVKILIKNADTQKYNKTWFYFARTWYFSHVPFFGGYFRKTDANIVILFIYCFRVCFAWSFLICANSFFIWNDSWCQTYFCLKFCLFWYPNSLHCNAKTFRC